ncbi:CopD family protein [Piscinibacter sakaiensis]|uniref:CopD family protein n=1 Tax=Piscinibacter sakaiensis TaxID=1547922 RepID=UPI003AABE9C1
MLKSVLLFLHLAGVIVWVGGMFFAYFCLRPAAVRTLEPPQRLPLWVASFETFLRYTAIAVVVIVASGFAMFLPVGFALAPPGWHVMLLAGLAMAAIFGHVNFALYPRLRRHSEAARWPEAAAALNAIRQFVAVNLVLAVVAVGAAALAR